MASSELVSFGLRVEQITSPAALKRIVDKAGLAAKDAAMDAARGDLGGDRAFSGFGRKIPLGAGYDHVGGSSIQLNFRPAGLWKLADQGRRTQGTILPRKRGKRAVLTPQGPRALSHYSTSRGLNTYTDAVKDAQRDAPKAAARQFKLEVSKAVR